MTEQSSPIEQDNKGVLRDYENRFRALWGVKQEDYDGIRITLGETSSEFGDEYTLLEFDIHSDDLSNADEATIAVLKTHIQSFQELQQLKGKVFIFFDSGNVVCSIKSDNKPGSASDLSIQIDSENGWTNNPAEIEEFDKLLIVADWLYEVIVSRNKN